jgi:hypothetical protein
VPGVMKECDGGHELMGRGGFECGRDGRHKWGPVGFREVKPIEIGRQWAGAARSAYADRLRVPAGRGYPITMDVRRNARGGRSVNINK